MEQTAKERTLAFMAEHAGDSDPDGIISYARKTRGNQYKIGRRGLGGC